MDTNYLISDYDFPVCNHTKDSSSENIGYTTGMTDDSFYFEAELYEYVHEGKQYKELAVVMTDMQYHMI